MVAHCGDKCLSACYLGCAHHSPLGSALKSDMCFGEAGAGSLSSDPFSLLEIITEALK